MRARSTRPASWRIADDLRERMIAGAIEAGGKLPSERELAEQFGTAARNTAREKPGIPADDGLVTAEHGRGVYVRKIEPLNLTRQRPVLVEASGQRSVPSLIECAKQGKTDRFEVLSIKRIKPSLDIAARLDVAPRAGTVLCRENVFYADADPVQRVTIYLPWTSAQDTDLLEAEIPHPYGVHSVFEDQCYVMGSPPRGDLRADADSGRAHVLRLPTGVPVLDVLHTSLDDQ